MSLLLAMALASAQPAPPPHENLVEDMHVVGQCLAQNQEQRVRSVLALDYRSNEYRDQLWQLMRDRNQDSSVTWLLKPCRSIQR